MAARKERDKKQRNGQHSRRKRDDQLYSEVKRPIQTEGGEKMEVDKGFYEAAKEKMLAPLFEKPKFEQIGMGDVV